jgi:pimeloyl-ACP methyl ester carboxylesterase
VKKKQGERVGRKQSESLKSMWTKVGDLLLHSRVSVNSSNAFLPPIILIHGLGVSSRYMIPLAEQLAPHFTVYALDLPGFGRSHKPPRVLNITELADALAGWMRENKLERARLLANSIGCQIIVDLALRRPEMVERIILVSPTVDQEARTVRQQFFRLLLDIPREPLSLSFIAIVDYLQAGLGRAAETFGYALQDPLEEKLPHVSQPALVVRGERDPLVSERWAVEVNRLLPESRLVAIPRAAHGVNYNSPVRLARIVLEFLKSKND